jgi:hypothetical protein
MEPTLDEAARIERALRRLRAAPVAYGPMTTGSHTPARRWVVTLEDGRRAFVKVATDDLTASWLRDEHLLYSVLRGAPFMPEYLGWCEDPRRPVLAIEDLSGAEWPPPWTPDRVDLVLGCLDEVAGTPPPEGLPRSGDDHLGIRAGWAEVTTDPAPFLALGMCSSGWLGSALPALREAAEAAPLDGAALLHFDVRSDNLCFRDGRALLVDWNWASVGHPLVDPAFWLPSLHAEGGPAPDGVLEPSDDLARLAAACAGFFCAHAARPPIPTAPHVRPLQLKQARTALPWAARALGLPEPA